MRILIVCAVGAVAALAAGAGLLLWSGIYNVAATEPHWKLTRSVLNFARHRSIAHHSRGIEAPLPAGEEHGAQGLEHYHVTCRMCHGAPGRPSAEFAAGLYPSPPYLPSGESQKRLTRPELFWVVKNGIKMTAMPAFGRHYDDRRIWDIVAAVRMIVDLTPEAYDELSRKRTARVHGEHARD